MRSPVRPSSQAWLVGGLAVLLAVLAGLQWRWIGQWSAVEEARMESVLRVGAGAVDRALAEHLLALREAFDGPPVRDAAADDTLAARLARWRAEAETPDLVADVYWVRPGPTPSLARLDGDSLRPEDWPEALAPWRTAAAAFPDRLTPEPGTSVARVALDDAALPATPPGLLVPVLPPGTADLRFVLVTLDPAGLGAVIDDLVDRHLPGRDDFDVRVVAASDRAATLYDEAPGAGPFASPDLDVGVGPGEVQELAIALDPPDGPSLVGPSAEPETAFVEARAEGADRHRWRLVAQHRAGSIGAAVGALRRRQLALALGVLGVLGAAVALVAAQARRQRALADRQLAFVAGVSHELRTPLAVLRSAGENLSDGVVGADAARRYGAVVRDEAARLADMVETVLTYAGADAAAPRRVRVPVADVVADALAQARPILDEAGTDVALAFAPSLPALDADPAAVATALRNLLGNAARHGGPHVRVESAPAELGGAPAVALVVSDDGPGFEPDLDAFEPFVRGRRAAEAQTPGSGLGLALVRRVAEAHGGEVVAGRSEAGGARVALTLPAAL